MLSLIVDGLIIVLLVATIAYCVQLNRRLSSLRKNEDQLKNMIDSFNQATVRAEVGIGALKKTADDIKDSLRSKVEDAKALNDELTFIIERGDALAGRLGGAISSLRDSPAPDEDETGESLAADETGLDSVPREGGEKPAKGKTSPRSRAERDLLKTLGSSR